VVRSPYVVFGSILQRNRPVNHLNMVWKCVHIWLIMARSDETP
jgi:hypothetical protein